MRARVAAALGLLLVSAAASFPSCRHTAPPERPNILLIVVDTLRADHLGSYGYAPPTSPRLDELARRGTRFAAARAASSWTLPSVASMLTGVYPAVHGAERSDSVLSVELGTMVEGFRDAGYRTAAFSANPAFVTPRQGLARGFDRFEVLHGAPAEKRARGAVPAHASLNTWVMEATAEDVGSAAIQWIGAGQDGAKPFFLYLHYFDPHAAYTPPAQFARRFQVSEDSLPAGIEQWSVLLAPQAPAPQVLQTLVRLYDAEIAAADAAIGHLLDEIPQALRESTITVVTSDHGEEFGEHGGLQHGRTLYDELLRVPLLLVGPGIPAGTIVETPVSLTGLWSTLSAISGAAAPPSDAVEPSFAESMQRETAADPVYADLEARFEADRQKHHRALIDGSWKLLLDPQRGSELYDLDHDSGEQHSSADAHDELRHDMRARILDRNVAAVTRRAIAPPRQLLLDAARREQLKALGYLQ